MKIASGQQRALELIDECIKTKNTVLELGNLGLKELPSEVEECTHLKELFLGKYYNHKYSKKKELFAQRIPFGDNKLISIPNSINNLTNLIHLSLDSNSISKIENLGSLINLESLDLTGNKISKIENLNSLINLKSLDLSLNLISKIENLDSLINLESLDLRLNEISKIENLESLVKLNSLNLQFNNITKEDCVNLNVVLNMWELNIWGEEIGKEVYYEWLSLKHDLHDQSDL